MHVSYLIASSLLFVFRLEIYCYYEWAISFAKYIWVIRDAIYRCWLQCSHQNCYRKDNIISCSIYETWPIPSVLRKSRYQSKMIRSNNSKSKLTHLQNWSININSPTIIPQMGLNQFPLRTTLMSKMGLSLLKASLMSQI